MIVDQDCEDNDEVPEEEKVSFMNYGTGMSHFDALKIYLQQQEFDTTNLAAELGKIMKHCMREHLKKLKQTNIDSFLISCFDRDLVDARTTSTYSSATGWGRW
ncbi:unnamed protein product [Calypogeia fissa]